jgi:hypothetical protein
MVRFKFICRFAVDAKLTPGDAVFQMAGTDNQQITGTIPTGLGELTNLNLLKIGKIENVIDCCLFGGDWMTNTRRIRQLSPSHHVPCLK